MRKLTFKSRLSLWFTTILASSLLISGIVFAIAYFSVSLVNRQNFMVREAVEVSEKHLTDKNGEIYFMKDDQGKTLSAYLRDEGLSAMVIDNSNTVIGSYGVYSGLLSTTNRESLVRTSDLNKVKIEGKQHFGLYDLYEGRTYLTLVYPVVSNGDIIGLLVLGSDMDFGRQMLVFALILIASIFPVSFILGWVATNWMVSKSFRPLESLLTKMRGFEVGKLSEKIYIRGNPKDELVRLSKSYNEMITRIDEGIEKQKEFITNTSHELKTPLTQSLLALDIVEMDLESNNTQKALAGVLKLKEDIKRYGEIINSLLELARIKQDTVKVTRVKVLDTVMSLSKNYSRSLDEKKLKLEVNIDNIISFKIPKEHFEIIFSNLFSNAIKYGVNKTTIKVNVFSKNDMGVFHIENSFRKSSGLDLDKIWRRFHRANIDNEVEGLGIGLSVVKDLVQLNNLKISNKLTADKRFVVEISGFVVE